MTIKELHTEHLQDSKAIKSGLRFNALLEASRKKDISEETVDYINSLIEEINMSSLTDKEWKKSVRRKQSRILKRLEKEEKLVAKNHYQTLWMSIGMAVFGIPLGTVLGVATDNMGLLGAGLPIGLAIGLAVGAAMDKKAEGEGRQLDF